MVVIKHISIKTYNYNSPTDYPIPQHDELTGKPILDEKRNHIPHQEFIVILTLSEVNAKRQTNAFIRIKPEKTSNLITTSSALIPETAMTTGSLRTSTGTRNGICQNEFPRTRSSCLYPSG